MFGIHRNKVTIHTAVHAMRIFNPARSQIIACRYKDTLAWSIPALVAREDKEPHEEIFAYIEEYFKGIKNIVGVMNVAETTRVIKKYNTFEELTVFLYDVETAEKQTQGLELFDPFDIVKWTNQTALLNESILNRITVIVKALTEKEN